MRVLYLGLEGDDVIAWQNFLRGISPRSNVVANGTFDATTKLWTQTFQRASSISADGIVGPMTLSKALALGFNPLVDVRLDQNGPNWPAKPAGVTQMSPNERAATFGTFAFVPAPLKNNPEAINITDGWVSENIVTIQIPRLEKLHASQVQFHKLIAPQVQGLFTAWEEAGLIDKIITWGGSWVPRYVRGSRTYLSNHSWGTAFDINAQWNMLGVQPALFGQHGSVRELVEIAYEYGMFWGGHYPTRPDGMHFECYKLIP